MPSSASSYSIINTLAEFDIQLASAPEKTAHLVNDSRQVQAGDIFCAVIGSAGDGRQFIDKAIAQGASLVIAQCHHQQQHGNQITRTVALDGDSEAQGNTHTAVIVQFYQLNEQLFDFAASYYQHPQKQLTLVGVTGTNGKTSTSQIIASLLSSCQQRTAVIGTTGAGELPNLTSIANTTPGPTELNQLMAQFCQQGISHVAMEVSSHALDQGRIDPKHLAVAVFTNLTRDHLDYHQTMDDYAAAKFGIFSQQAEQVAVINGDDDYGNKWLAKLNQKASQPVIAFGKNDTIKSNERYVLASDIELSAQGLCFTVTTEQGQAKITSQLIGAFNVDNLLAAIATLLALDIPLAEIAQHVSQVQPSQGRMETFHLPEKPVAVVDYAHTPDALANALMACREHCEGELWVVFGCGGDRDKGKRSEMGEVAEKYADHVVITNDNPRSEAPELIANDILSGCAATEKITVMLDRKQAVRSALAHAKANDVVLLAGKGHENTIEIAGKITEYSERGLVASIYQQGEQA